MRRYVLSPSAADDLRAIGDYIRQAAGDDLAARMIRQIQDKCRLIAKNPGEIGTIRDEIREGLRSFVVSPYVLFYRYTDSTVEIIRVLHERQDVRDALDE